MFIKDKLSKTNSKINIDDIDLEIVEKIKEDILYFYSIETVNGPAHMSEFFGALFTFINI